MATFLMWNVDRKPLDGLVQSLVRLYKVDLVLLVEDAFGASRLDSLLRQDGFSKRASLKRFGVFSRTPHHLDRQRGLQSPRAVLYRWTPPSGREGLVGLVHGLDRRNYDDHTRRISFRRIVEVIRRRERSLGHQRTLLTGDFNAHPFESAVAAADGIHAIGIRSVTSRGSRMIRGEESQNDFFYNPMWRLYGSQPGMTSGMGTHYWLGQQCQEFGWHLLDQVFIRPGEVERFPEANLRILTDAGGVSLLNEQGLPDRSAASDHLPLWFDWDL